MSTRKNDPVGTREAILAAAMDLFAEQGVGRVSMSRIAAQAGITKSLIHHHFGSKQDLWNAVREQGMGEYLMAQRELLLNRPADANLFVDSIDTYFRYLQRRPTLVRLMAWMAVDPESAAEKQVDEVLELGVQRLEEGKLAGLVSRDVDSQAAIMSFLGTIERWFVNRGMFFGEMTEEQVAALDETFLNTIKQVYVRGMAPVDAKPGDD
jgi:TetR/AcrR family transcriptional regulator